MATCIILYTERAKGVNDVLYGCTGCTVLTCPIHLGLKRGSLLNGGGLSSGRILHTRSFPLPSPSLFSCSLL